MPALMPARKRTCLGPQRACCIGDSLLLCIRAATGVGDWLANSRHLALAPSRPLAEPAAAGCHRRPRRRPCRPLRPVLRAPPVSGGGGAATCPCKPLQRAATAATPGLVPHTYAILHRRAGGAGGGTVAKDALGNDVKASAWLATHGAGDRSLVQGLKVRPIRYSTHGCCCKLPQLLEVVQLARQPSAGRERASSQGTRHTLPRSTACPQADATYLIVTNEGNIESYGLNAVCTHLGCVVPWNKAENKFMCPCHGSQYNAEGKKIRGPAPLSLALAHCDVADDIVSFTTW